MNYITDVSELLLARCPNIAILGPTDYTIIAEWEKQEIPLEIVFRSINEVCDKVDGESVTAESIVDFQGRVEQNFRDWLANKERMNQTV